MKIINFFVFSVALLLTACGGSGGDGDSQNKVSLAMLEISANLQEIDYQEAIQLNVLAINSDQTSEALLSGVVFSSSNNNIVSISDTGLITALSEGEASVSASYQGKESSIPITVNYSVVDSEIRISPETDQIVEGTNYQYNLWVEKTDGISYLITEGVVWSSSDDTVATISSNGLLMLLTSGEVNVSVETAFGDVNIERNVSIEKKEISNISIELSSTQVALGFSSNALITVLYNNDTSENLSTGVTFSSDDLSIADINNDGVVSSIALGTTVLNAEFNGFTSSVDIEITNAVINDLLFNLVQNSIPVGMTPLYVVQQQFSDGSLTDITDELESYTLSSDDSNIASINNSLITTTNPGSVNLTVTAGELTASTLLTVSEAVVTAITLSADSLALGVSGEVSTTATLSSGEEISINPVYSSSDEAVLSVNESGIITSTGIGRATITGLYDGLESTVVVDVNPAVLASLSVNFENLTLPLGRTIQASAIGIFTDGTSYDITEDVSWSSANTDLLSVSNTSKGEMTAHNTSATDFSSPVTVIVTASLNGIDSNAELDVVSAVIDTLEITAESNLVSLGNQLKLTATATYSNSESIDISNSASWSSNNETLATISNNGLISTITEGLTSVSASFDGLTESFQVTVGPATLNSISISSDSTSVLKGRTKQLNSEGTKSDGSIIPATTLGVWSIADDDNLLASISNDAGTEGVFTAIEAGIVNVTFTPDDQSLPEVIFVQLIQSISEIDGTITKRFNTSLSTIDDLVRTGSRISLAVTNNIGGTINLLKFVINDANGDKLSTSDSSFLSDGALSDGEAITLTYIVGESLTNDGEGIALTYTGDGLGATKPITLTFEAEDSLTNELFDISITIN